MTRAVPMIETDGRMVREWIGATPDSAPPDHVRLRIFRRYDGRCYLSKAKIRPGDDWQIEHIKPLHLKGENRERNMAPALKAPHAEKSAAETTARAKADRQARAHFGLKAKPKGRPLTHPTLKRGFDGIVRPREIQS